MRINISDIIKTDGAYLNAEFSGHIPELEGVVDGFEFKDPVVFNGKLQNIGGILKLIGSLKVSYFTKCYKCLNDMKREVVIPVREDFIHAEKAEDSEAYTYEGNYVSIDKVMKDNIVLNLPMKEACSDSCKGLCPRCGADLNKMDCGCSREEEFSPKMEKLKDFFK